LTKGTNICHAVVEACVFNWYVAA